MDTPIQANNEVPSGGYAILAVDMTILNLCHFGFFRRTLSHNYSHDTNLMVAWMGSTSFENQGGYFVQVVELPNDLTDPRNLKEGSRLY